MSIKDNNQATTMRLVSAIFICYLTVYHPAIAVITTPTDEKVNPIPQENLEEQDEQSTTTMPANPKENILIEKSLGLMLYENHCINCHESTAHIRAKRRAKNYGEIGYFVNQWADWLDLGWTAVEKREVMQYLNQRYYKYPMTQ